MKKSIKKIKSFSGVIVSAALMVLCLIILSSCGNEPDISSVPTIPENFLDAIENLDRDAAKNCAPGFDSSEWDQLGEAWADTVRLTIQQAEITEIGEPAYFAENEQASVEITISYLSLKDAVGNPDNDYISSC